MLRKDLGEEGEQLILFRTCYGSRERKYMRGTGYKKSTRNGSIEETLDRE